MANFTGNPNQVYMDNLDRWMIGLFGVGVAVSPISRVAMGILLIPAVCILLFRFYREEHFQQIWSYRKTVFGGVIIAIFGWFAFTSIFSLDADKSFQVTIRTFLMILIALILYRYCLRREGLAIFGLKIGLAFFTIWSLIGIYFIYFDLQLFQKIFYSILGLTHRLVFFKNDGALAVVFLTIAVYLGLVTEGKFRWVYVFSLIVILLFVYANGVPRLVNRSGLTGNAIGIIGAITLIGIAKFSFFWRRVTVAAIFIISLVATTFVMERLAPITEIGGTPPAPNLSYPDHHRQVIWAFVYEKFQDSPIVGVGIDAIAKTENADTKLVYFSGQEYVPSHPHNWILEVGAETGVIGIVLVLSAMALFVIYLLDLYRQDKVNKKMIFILLYFFCGFWTISMAAFSIWSSWWLISFFITTAMMLSVVKEKASA